MSRSRRKTWIISNCGGRGDEPLHDIDEVSDIWSWRKDGKGPFKDPKYARK